MQEHEAAAYAFMVFVQNTIGVDEEPPSIPNPIPCAMTLYVLLLSRVLHAYITPHEDLCTASALCISFTTVLPWDPLRLSWDPLRPLETP